MYGRAHAQSLQDSEDFAVSPNSNSLRCCPLHLPAQRPSLCMPCYMIITPLSHVSKGRAPQSFSGCCTAESLELKAADATAQKFTDSVHKDQCWISIYAGAVGFAAYIISA